MTRAPDLPSHYRQVAWRLARTAFVLDGASLAVVVFALMSCQYSQLANFR